MRRKLLVVFVSIILLTVFASIVAVVIHGPHGDNVSLGGLSTVLTGARSAESVRTENFVLAASENLRVVNRIGAISIRGGDHDYVEVHATMRSSAPTREQSQCLLDQIRIDASENQTHTEIIATVPRNWGDEQAVVDLEILVPHLLVMELLMDAGDIQICCIAGDVTVENKLGRVEMDSFTGNATLVAHHGDVIIRNSDFVDHLHILAGLGDVSVSGTPAESNSIISNMGDVTIRLPEGWQYAISAGISFGRFNALLPFSGEQSARSVQGYVGIGEEAGSLSVTMKLGSLTVSYQ